VFRFFFRISLCRAKLHPVDFRLVVARLFLVGDELEISAPTGTAVDLAPPLQSRCRPGPCPLNAFLSACTTSVIFPLTGLPSSSAAVLEGSACHSFSFTKLGPPLSSTAPGVLSCYAFFPFSLFLTRWAEFSIPIGPLQCAPPGHLSFSTNGYSAAAPQQEKELRPSV